MNPLPIADRSLDPSPPQMTRILLAYEFSDSSEASLSVALRLASTFHAHLTILHVFEYSEAASRRTGGIAEGLFALRESAEQRLENLLHRAKQSTPDVDTVMVDGIAAHAILDAADRVDLVILGTKAAHGSERLLLGSTAESVFRKATCPVVTVGPLVPSADQGLPPGPVIFATDFNVASLRSISYAAYLCGQMGSSLHCLHVLPQSSEKPEEKLLRQRSTTALKRIVSEGGLSIPDPVCAVTYNREIPAGVVDYARRHKADFIVLGLRQASALAAHLPPNIAYRIIAEAHCPVLTVTSDQ